MQLLESLTIKNVALSTGNVFDMPGIDQPDFQPIALKDFKDRYPVYAGGLHSNGCNTTGGQPLGKALKIVSKTGEFPHRLFIRTFGDGHKVALGANVDTGGIGVQVLQMLGQLDALSLDRLFLFHNPASEFMIGMTGKGSCRIRLSSERDSKCFTNDKYASSRTTLILGHRAPVVLRPPHPGCRIQK